MRNIKKLMSLSLCICIMLIMGTGSICIAEENNNESILKLRYSPCQHDFGDMYEGERDSTTFEIWMDGCCGDILYYMLTEDCSWLDVSPTSGTSTGEHDTITVSIDTTGLDNGLHSYNKILIESNGGNGQFGVFVNITRAPYPMLLYYPQAHDFGDKIPGETDDITFEIWNCGIDTISYDLSEKCSWVDVSPTSGTSTGEHDTITVSINTTGLDKGLHICIILIESNGGNGMFNVTVNVQGIQRVEIADITGSLFKVHAVIENTGNLIAYNINWDIALNGGLIMMGQKTSGELLTIPIGEKLIIGSDLIFGFGKTTVTVTATVSESSDVKEQEAFVFLFFIKT